MKPSRKSHPRIRRAARRSAPRTAPVLSTIPGIRRSRVATAQARIAADYYRRADVRDRLVDALLRELQER